MNDPQGQHPEWFPQQPPYDQPPSSQPQWNQQQPPAFYTQQTQMYSGQFQPPASSSPQPPKKSRGLLAWYRAQTRFAKLGLGCGFLVLLCILCICSVTAFASTLPQPKVTPTQIISVTQTPTTQPASLLTTATTKPAETPIAPLNPTATPTATSIQHQQRHRSRPLRQQRHLDHNQPQQLRNPLHRLLLI